MRGDDSLFYIPNPAPLQQSFSPNPGIGVPGDVAVGGKNRFILTVDAGMAGSDEGVGRTLLGEQPTTGAVLGYVATHGNEGATDRVWTSAVVKLVERRES